LLATLAVPSNLEEIHIKLKLDRMWTAPRNWKSIDDLLTTEAFANLRTLEIKLFPTVGSDSPARRGMFVSETLKRQLKCLVGRRIAHVDFVP
jgi:hypothetical protein